jgi:predicted homoserine dehydrogenase-like protein
MGDGPYYCFYTPYHLPHLQVLTTVARAALFQDATTSPVGAPCTEVLTVAKRDLVAGDILDGIGGFDTYGDIDNAPIAARERCLPMGLSQGCTLTKDVRKDQVITYGDVSVRKARPSDKLRAQQDALFAEQLNISNL